MKLVNIQEAKTQLSRLVEEAAGGQEIVIAKAGKPMVRLVRLADSATPRKLGALAGAVSEAPDCWEPDPEMEKLFYGDEEGDGSSAVAEKPPKGRG